MRATQALLKHMQGRRGSESGGFRRVRTAGTLVVKAVPFAALAALAQRGPEASALALRLRRRVVRDTAALLELGRRVDDTGLVRHHFQVARRAAAVGASAFLWTSPFLSHAHARMCFVRSPARCRWRRRITSWSCLTRWATTASR